MAVTEGAVLLVHGAWHGAWCWQDLARRLGDLGHDVRTVELRGHDQRAGRIWHRVQDYVEDVREAASGCPTPLVVVGHSLGGLVVQKYLEQGHAAGMVLLAPVPSRGTIPAIGRLARRHPVALLEATLTLRLRPFVRTPALVRELFFTATSSQETVDNTWRRLRDESYLAFLETAVLRPRPERIRSRVLVVAAEHDWFFTLTEMQQTARAYRTEAVVIEGAGHDLMLDSGWPELARRVDHWTRVTVAAAS
jgi:pimeloyl-ACP methyl ester carboxylesterase